MSTFSTKACYLSATVLRIARFMMAQSPKDAELLLTMYRPEIVNLISRGYGAVRFEFPDGPANYIVVEKGRRYTTSIPPRSIPEDQIEVVRLSQAEPILLPKLQRACQSLEEFSPDVYSKLNIAKILEAVSVYYELNTVEIQQTLDYKKIQQVLYNKILRIHLQLISSDPSISLQTETGVCYWAQKLKSELENGYAGLLLSGDLVQQSVSCLYFYCVSLVRADYLFDLGIMNTPSLFPNQPNIKPFPILEIRYYMSHPELIYDSLEEIAMSVLKAAQDFRTRGDKLRDIAQTQASFQSFHHCLYSALLNYRCAQEIYDSLILLYSKSLKNLKDIKRYANFCEEMRVAIMVSLSHVAVDFEQETNFTDIPQFEKWMIELHQ
jgi:hypothetical protein